MGKINVLSVDDDAINLKLLNVYLKRSGLVDKIFEASNGLEAIDIIKENENEIDLILLDIKMPIMDGVEFLSVYRTNAHKSIPIVVLTTDDTLKGDVIERGATDFMVKPIKEELLNMKLKEIIEIL